ncbi:importin, putative [Ixodes scapularis]|uniref:Importin, putative n=1 Tax=Ixodes scapularis TaxID=6945 RepID=B7Q6V0_IXOSC|nr:importin, putative [Ixodes scapularis]|eukprot:XP_002403419.1 importin, putative [Ixodes scapularis]
MLFPTQTITILHVTSFIIERVGSQIMPYAGDLVHYLPLLWETSGDHNMLRCAIVTTLVQVVEGLGVHSEKLHPFLLPVVAFGVDILQSPHVYLLEDTLDLWWAVLNNTSSTSTDLLQLAHYLFPLFGGCLWS